VPIFEYKCESCGHIMEVLQKTNREKSPLCDKCSSHKLKRLLSGFSVGQSKPSGPACESCPGEPCQESGRCPAME